MADEILETLAVRIIAETDGLREALDNAVKEARDKVKELEAALSLDLTGLRQQLEGALNISDAAKGAAASLTETGDAAKAAGVEVARAFDGVSADALADEIRRVNKQMRDLDAQLKAGSVSRDEWRAETQRLRAEMQELWAAANKGRTELPRVAAAQQELTDKIKDLSTQVRTARNLWAARITDDAEFTRSTQALHNEMSVLASTADLTNEQMRQLTQGMAFAQRGLDSAAGAASRGGLAWTAQIAIANQFEQQLRGLGPAGSVAAGALGLVSGAITTLNGPLELSAESFRRLGTTVIRFTRLLPLLSGAAVVGATAALHKMAMSSVSLANDLASASRSTGLSVESLQEWRYAAEQSGVSAERFTTLLTSLQRRMGAAADGNKSYAAAFEQLGVTLRDADGQLRSLEDVLPEVAEGLTRITNETERTRIATTIMNRSGAALIPMLTEGAEALAEYREEARELGIVISGDSVMSLAEYGNQVNAVTRQFEAARVEIVAAFLPVLQNVLMPLIQNVVVPWLQETANRVKDFADRLVDTGEAGKVFRENLVRSLVPLLRFGDAVSGAYSGFLGFTNLVMAGAAAIGAYLGNMSVQVERFFTLFSDLADAVRNFESHDNLLTAFGSLTGSIRALQGAAWDPNEAREAARVAAEGYMDKAFEEADKGNRRLARAFSDGQYYEDLFGQAFAAMADGVAGGAAAGFAEADFEGTVADAVSGGVAAGVAAAKEDPKVKAALENLALANMGMAVDGPFGSEADRRAAEERLAKFTATFEREEARRVRIAEYADDERTRSAERNAARHRQLMAATTAFLERELRRRALAVTELQPDEGVAGSGRASAGRSDAANARIAAGAAADAAAARTAERHREAAAATRAWDEQLTALANGMAAIDREASLFGETSSTLSARIALQRQHVLWLAQEYPEATKLIAAARAELEHLETALEALDRIPGLQWMENLKSGLTDIQALSDRVAAVTGTAPSEVEALTASLQRLAQQGGVTGIAAAGLLAQLTAFEAKAPDRVIEAMSAELAAAAASARVFGTETQLAGVQADILGAAIETLIPMLGEESELIAQLTQEYRALRAEQEAREAVTTEAVGSTLTLTDAFANLFGAFREGGITSDSLAASLSTISSGFRNLAGATGGVAGELLNFGAAVTDIAVKAIQGDWVGAIMTAITTLFDFSNGLEEIRAQVDQMAASGRYAGRELIEGFAQANTERQRRTGPLGWLGLTKTVIDKEAVQLAVSIAEAVGGAMASAFSATDIKGFHESWARGLDRVIEQEIINGFILGEAAQTKIKEITEAILAGNYGVAEALFRQLEEDAELVWWQLQRWRGPVDDTVTKTQDWVSVLERAAALAQQISETRLGRAFEQGTIGLREYAAELQRLTTAGVDTEYGARIRALQEELDRANREGNKELAAALAHEMDVVREAYRDALVQGAWEAEQEIRSILGTGMDTLQGDLRSAFDASTTEDFTEAFAKNLRTTTRNALISGFLESEAVKPLLEELSSGLTTAVLTGDFSAATLAGLQGTVDEITHVSTTFFDMLDKLGFGFDDLTDNVNELNASMSNVPTIFKSTQAVWDATTLTTPGSVFNEARTVAHNTLELNINAPVYGVEDLDNHVRNLWESLAEEPVNRFGRTN